MLLKKRLKHSQHREFCESADEESQVVADWIRQRLNEGVEPHEVAVFVRSQAQVSRAQEAVVRAQIPGE